MRTRYVSGNGEPGLNSIILSTEFSVGYSHQTKDKGFILMAGQSNVIRYETLSAFGIGPVVLSDEVILHHREPMED